MSKKVRDAQAKAIYAAEDTISSQEFGSLDEFDDFLTGVMETKWFKARWPSLKGLATYDGRGQGWADGRSLAFGNILVAEITAPVKSRTAMYGLHELAHVCDTRKVLLHDEIFVGIELALVGFVLGRRKRTRLQAALVERGVAWTIYKRT